MKTHYFQRYHGRENVATANTMLLLSRLYSYSSDKFFRFLKQYLPDGLEPELTLSLQEKGENSIPDAIIAQEGFKIVVETKLHDTFRIDQLMNHLTSFGDEKNKVLISLAPESMSNNMQREFEAQLREYNNSQTYPVTHFNTTFKDLTNAIHDVIEDRDYEMNDILEDYLEYCDIENLIPRSNALMRMRLSNNTFEYNIKNDIYREDADRGFREHDYLGLYKNKSIRAIGKICARITALKKDDDKIDYIVEKGELTEERAQKIQNFLHNDEVHGHSTKNTRYRYFFVEHFYEMDYKKTSRGGSMGTKYFDLSQILDLKKATTVEDIAKMLSQQTWE